MATILDLGTQVARTLASASLSLAAMCVSKPRGASWITSAEQGAMLLLRLLLLLMLLRLLRLLLLLLMCCW